MNILLKIFLFISVIKAIIVALLLIGAIVLWIGGGDNILLPGPGLVISVPFLIILLLAAEIFLIACVIFLRRYLAKTRLQ